MAPGAGRVCPAAVIPVAERRARDPRRASRGQGRGSGAARVAVLPDAGARVPGLDVPSRVLWLRSPNQVPRFFLPAANCLLFALALPVSQPGLGSPFNPCWLLKAPFLGSTRLPVPSRFGGAEMRGFKVCLSSSPVDLGVRGMAKIMGPRRHFFSAA